MSQQLSSPHESSSRELDADPDHDQVLLFPTRLAVCDPTDLRSQSATRPVIGARSRVSTCVIGQVVVLRVAGRLSDVVEDLDRTMQLALADEPRGVVCDLSAALGGFEPVAVEVLATVGRHVRDWPGIPVAVACPDPQVRAALRAHPLGGHLIVAESLFCAISKVLATPTLTIGRLRLAPHPTAPRASRNFVTRTLLDWQLSRVTAYASLVVSELVTSSCINAGTDIDLSVVWNLGALRLCVRDHGPGLPGQPHPDLDLHGRRLTVVARLARAFGVLSTANGGKVVWAVLDAPRQSPPTSHHRREDQSLEDQSQEDSLLHDAQGLTGHQSSRILERSHR